MNSADGYAVIAIWQNTIIATEEVKKNIIFPKKIQKNNKNSTCFLLE